MIYKASLRPIANFRYTDLEIGQMETRAALADIKASSWLHACYLFKADIVKENREVSSPSSYSYLYQKHQNMAHP